MAPPQTLLSLPEDVLREILVHLLLDTPRSSTRAAILGTCSLLHELGLPSLYRVVNIADVSTKNTLLRFWKDLFAEGGQFAIGRVRGRLVRELKLGGEMEREGFRSMLNPPVPLGFSLSPTLSLPSCTSLVLDLYLHSSSLDSFNSKATHTLLQALLPQLPVLDLTLSLDGGLLGPPSICERMITPLAVVLNTSTQQPWPSLRSITHQGKIWCTPRSGPPFSTPLQLALARWTCEIVVFEFSPPEWHELAGGPKEFDILLDPLPKESQADFLRETRRVEFRLKGQFADAFEHRFRDDLGRRTERGLSDHELRITSLIVFVDEKGKGRTLAVCEYDRVAPLT